MSLMKTLAKVAIGVALAKGATAMTRKAGSGGGGLLEQLAGGRSRSTPQGGGLDDLLGAVLGGRTGNGAPGGGTQGGLGGLLDGLSQASRPAGGGTTGGLDDILQGAARQGGGLQDMLGGLLGGALGGALGGMPGSGGSRAGTAPETNKSAGKKKNSRRSFAEEFNRSLAGEEPEPEPHHELAAALMLRAMIQAAKCDGRIDDSEREKLLDRLGDVSPEERDFVTAELQAPVDAGGLARQVPPGLEPQVYAMSVLAIDLDSQAEAQYLHDLAGALGLGKQQVNDIHARLGVPALYA